MVRRPKYPCRHRGCSALVDGPGYCPEHAAESVGWHRVHQRGNRHQRGYGIEWDKTRARILRRDGYLCQCEECQGETGIVGWAASINWIGWAGVLIALLDALANVYYQRRRDRRERSDREDERRMREMEEQRRQELHAAQMAAIHERCDL